MLTWMYHQSYKNEKICTDKLTFEKKCHIRNRQISEILKQEIKK